LSKKQKPAKLPPGIKKNGLRRGERRKRKIPQPVVLY